jgi:uncharacterized ubiquitin-like protein YukD
VWCNFSAAFVLHILCDFRRSLAWARGLIGKEHNADKRYLIPSIIFCLSFCKLRKNHPRYYKQASTQVKKHSITETQKRNTIIKMTGDVSTGNHNLSLKLTIRLSSSTRFDIGSCGSITPSSTIQQVKTIISQREEADHCAVERQRLIYKGRILSDNTRTLADYGIGRGDTSGDGIIIYLVKGSATTATTSGSGGGGAATNTTAAANNTNNTPASSTNNAAASNTQTANNPFLNFGASGSNANNPMANLLNSMGGGMGGGFGGGGMPDMATFQQEMMNNPQMMQEMMNNPMVSVCSVFFYRHVSSVCNSYLGYHCSHHIL